jgi:hypothetical protein
LLSGGAGFAAVEVDVTGVLAVAEGGDADTTGAAGVVPGGAPGAELVS